MTTNADLHGAMPELPEPDTTWYASWANDRVKFHSTDQIYEFASARVRAALASQRVQVALLQEPAAWMIGGDLFKTEEAAKSQRRHLEIFDQIYPLYPADPKPNRWADAAMPPDIERRLAPWLTNGAALHPLTINLVVRFSRALAAKLAAAEVKYGYSDGWQSPGWMDECREKLTEHVAKGDPRDAAAYCAFLWHHGESTATPAAEQGRPWCQYIAGMIECYLKTECSTEDREAAIAGIIERRMHRLPAFCDLLAAQPKAPAAKQGDTKP